MESLAEDGYDVIFNLEYDFEALISGTGELKTDCGDVPGYHVRVCQ